ncbi:unnamed protein product, partial [Rotaria sp. Silwood2]
KNFITVIQTNLTISDALNVLGESLSDKIRLFGELSEEIIQTESRIGAVYLRKDECLNAAQR